MTRVFISYGVIQLVFVSFSVFRFFTNVSFIVAPSCCSHFVAPQLDSKESLAWMRMRIIRERGKDIWHGIVLSGSCFTIDGFGQLYSTVVLSKRIIYQQQRSLSQARAALKID